MLPLWEGKDSHVAHNWWIFYMVAVGLFYIFVRSSNCVCCRFLACSLGWPEFCFFFYKIWGETRSLKYIIYFFCIFDISKTYKKKMYNIYTACAVACVFRAKMANTEGYFTIAHPLDLFPPHFWSWAKGTCNCSLICYLATNYYYGARVNGLGCKLKERVFRRKNNHIYFYFGPKPPHLLANKPPINLFFLNIFLAFYYHSFQVHWICIILIINVQRISRVGPFIVIFIVLVQ